MTGRRETGQASVELALVLPLLFALLLVIAQVALLAVDEILVVTAAREAARVAAVTSADPTGPARIAALASGHLDPARLGLVIGGDPHVVSAQVTYRVAVIVPFWGHLGGHPTVSAQARMAREG